LPGSSPPLTGAAGIASRGPPEPPYRAAGQSLDTRQRRPYNRRDALAGRDGVPWAVWDNARLALFRDYLGGEELAYQRFLADLRADPRRYYAPGVPVDLPAPLPGRSGDPACQREPIPGY